MQPTQTAVLVSMAPDCTIRRIEQAREALLQGGTSPLLVACDAVEQADVTFVQLIVSAQASCAVRGQSLQLRSVPECVRNAFERAAVHLPSGP